MSQPGSNIDDRFLEEYIKRQQSRSRNFGDVTIPRMPSEARRGYESKQAQMKMAAPVERQYNGAFEDSVDKQQMSVVYASQPKSGFRYTPASLKTGFTVTGT